jgi:hypothetical protein
MDAPSRVHSGTSVASAASAAMMNSRHQQVLGPGCALPLDRNAPAFQFVRARREMTWGRSSRGRLASQLALLEALAIA